MDPNEAELESFRRQWREEVKSRSKTKANLDSARRLYDHSQKLPATPPLKPGLQKHHFHTQKNDGEQQVQWRREPAQSTLYEETKNHENANNLGKGVSSSPEIQRAEPETALEHYEMAVEREGQGSLGDSVRLYRKAFRMDDRVHEAYKNKHFPPAHSKGTGPLSQAAGGTQAHNPESQPLRFGFLNELITSFAGVQIEGEPAPTDLSPPTPCPIARVPDEILADILMYAAITDVGAYVGLAGVCKRLAYFVMTDERIWRRVVLGPEFGIGAMHYKWILSVTGKPRGEGERLLSSYSPLKSVPSPANHSISAPFQRSPLVPDPYPTYRNMFRNRPRIRFNGVYISTVNYTRPGAHTSTVTTWGAPVHIVTYYRYLRFFRDGAAISLLTTAEPSEVIPHFRPENVGAYPYVKEPVHSRRGTGPQWSHSNPNATSAPPPVMKDALPGRWKLSGPDDPLSGDEEAASEDEGAVYRPDSLYRFPSGRVILAPAPVPDAADDPQGAHPTRRPRDTEGAVYIETLGPVPHYRYFMSLGLTSAAGGAGKGGARGGGTKLAWRGYWSHNRLTDDWGVFGLKNDRAFYFSRVRRFGLGFEAGWRPEPGARE